MHPEVDNLISKIMRCHWGPQPAASVLKPVGEHTQGSLNLLWIIQGFNQRVVDPTLWFNTVALSKETVLNYPVHEWATLYRPPQFYEEIVRPNSSLFSVRRLEHWRKYCLANY